MLPLETAPADGTGAANFTRRLRHVLVAALTSGYRGTAEQKGLDRPVMAIAAHRCTTTCPQLAKAAERAADEGRVLTQSVRAWKHPLWGSSSLITFRAPMLCAP